MRAFVILSLAAVVSAGSLGYNYQSRASGSGISVVSGGPSIGSVGSSLGGGALLGGGVGLGSGIGLGSGVGGGSGIGLVSALGGRSSIGLGSVLDGGSSIGLGSDLGGGSLVSSGSGISLGGLGGSTHQVVDGGLSKEFYLYSAPEEDGSDDTQNSVTSIKRNLRVVFIKAPENTAVNRLALQVAKQASEDKTAIYVLSKQPDVAEIANQIRNLQESVKTKPEVRFIKYRTHEDALNAQRSIQQEYDALGGSSQSSDEGVAPVLNYASPAELVSSVSVGGGSIGAGSIGGGLASGSPIGIGSIGGGLIDGGSLGGGDDLVSIGASSVSSGQKDYLPPIVY